mgnify:CR=1 FL=1
MELSDPGGSIMHMIDNQNIKVLRDDPLFYAHEKVEDGEIYILFDPQIEHDEYKQAFAACDIDPRCEVIHSGFDQDLGKEFVLLAVVK